MMVKANGVLTHRNWSRISSKVTVLSAATQGQSNSSLSPNFKCNAKVTLSIRSHFPCFIGLKIITKKTLFKKLMKQSFLNQSITGSWSAGKNYRDMNFSGALGVVPQQVPVPVALRVRFDPEAERFITNLTAQIESNVSVFQSQAQYSVVPYHIKLLELPPSLLQRNSSVYFGTSSDSSAYYTRIRDVVSRFANTLHGDLLPQCRVDLTSGEVCLKIKSQDCLMLGGAFVSAIPGCNGWYSSNGDNLLVSIGRFLGAQKQQFQVWLDQELSGNKELFPKFSSNSLEFSEAWMSAGFPQQVVPLSGGLRFNSFEPFGSSASPLGVGADSLGSIVGVGGIGGVLGVGVGMGTGGYAAVVGGPPGGGIRPEVTPGMGMGMGVGMGVGAAGVGAGASGGVGVAPAVPVASGSTVSAGSGSSAPPTAASGSSTAAPATASAATSAPADGPTTTTTTAAASGAATTETASPSKQVWGPAGGGVPARLREGLTGDNGTVIVSGIKPASAGTKAAGKAGSTAATAKASTNGNSSAGQTTTAATAATAAATATAATAAAAAAGVDGKGEPMTMVAWICPSCKVENFPRRNVCFKCHAARPEQLGLIHLHPRKPIITANKPDGDVRDGDWTCSNCRGHNFASKIACFTCRASRPDSEGSDLDSSTGGAGVGAGAGNKAGSAGSSPRPSSVKPGDWTCPKCKENVFAHRNRCYKCTTLKPSIEAAPAPAIKGK